MRVVHEVFNVTSEGKKLFFYWIIHIATYVHAKVLNTIVVLSSCLHDNIKPVIEGSPMIFSICFN